MARIWDQCIAVTVSESALFTVCTIPIEPPPCPSIGGSSIETNARDPAGIHVPTGHERWPSAHVGRDRSARSSRKASPIAPKRAAQRMPAITSVPTTSGTWVAKWVATRPMARAQSTHRATATRTPLVAARILRCSAFQTGEFLSHHCRHSSALDPHSVQIRSDEPRMLPQLWQVADSTDSGSALVRWVMGLPGSRPGCDCVAQSSRSQGFESPLTHSTSWRNSSPVADARHVLASAAPSSGHCCELRQNP